MTNTTSPIEILFQTQRRAIEDSRELFERGIDVQQNAAETLVDRSMEAQRTAHRQGVDAFRQLLHTQLGSFDGWYTDEIRTNVDDNLDAVVDAQEDAMDEIERNVHAVVEELNQQQRELFFESLEAFLRAHEEAEAQTVESVRQAESAARTVQDEARETARTAQESVGEATEAAADATGTVVEETADAAEETVETAAAATEDVAEETADLTEDVAEETAETTEDIAEETAETTEDIAEETAETTEDIAEETAETTEDVAEETAEAGQEAAEAAAAEGAADESEDEEEEHQLEDIDGLGETYAQRLHDAGIQSFTHLAQADAETIAEAADVSEDRAEGWSEKARSRAQLDE